MEFTNNFKEEIIDIDEYNNDEYNSSTSASTRKRGRPNKKNNRHWAHEETSLLIQLWTERESLYNRSHLQYFDKVQRAKSIEEIGEGLIEAGYEVTKEEVMEKMTKLRDYFGIERRKLAASKKSGNTELYVSRWKFYSAMSFLKDHMTSRQKNWHLAKKKEDAADASMDDDYNGYQTEGTPVAGSSRKITIDMAAARMGANHPSMNFNAPGNEVQSLEINSSIEQQHQEDRCFADMIFQMLKEVPDSETKSMAKLDFHQKLIQLRYNSPKRYPHSISLPSMATHQDYGESYHKSSRSGSSSPRHSAMSPQISDMQSFTRLPSE